MIAESRVGPGWGYGLRVSFCNPRKADARAEAWQVGLLRNVVAG